MNTFRVWARPLGDRVCRLRVEGGRKNTDWLLDRLSRSFAFKTAESVHEEEGSACCTFQVMHSSQIPFPALQRLLAGMPEVKLMTESV